MNGTTLPANGTHVDQVNVCAWIAHCATCVGGKWQPVVPTRGWHERHGQADHARNHGVYAQAIHHAQRDHKKTIDYGKIKLCVDTVISPARQCEFQVMPEFWSLNWLDATRHRRARTLPESVGNRLHRAAVLRREPRRKRENATRRSKIPSPVATATRLNW